MWGPSAWKDLLTDYFTHKLVEKNWLDIEPLKIKPTWKNNRCGEGRFAKRLDCFLVIEKMVDMNHSIRQWVGSGGHSNHFPIFLDFRNGPQTPPSHLKLSKT